MATMEVTVSWAAQVQDANLRGWRVYASRDESTRGSLVTEEPADARSSTFEIEEGEYHFTVVPVSMADVEGPWEKSRARERVFVPGRTHEAPSAPTTVAVQQVSPDVGARVTVDPVPPNEDADRVQVIEGSDPETGKILAEVPVPRAGPREESAPLPSVNIPMDGSADGVTPTTRPLQVRTVTKGGVPSPPVSRTVVMPERAQMHRAAIASILTAGGGSISGFPTPDGSLSFTHVGADGFKTTRLPAGNDSAGWALLGAADTGSRFTGMRLTPYPQFVKIESNEIDLGADVVFSLECFDQVQRVTAAGLLASIPGWALSLYPGAPGLVRDIDDDNTLGPAWLTRCMSGEGKLRFPIRQVRWEYVASASSSVPHADGDYVPVVPGAWISGRFVRVRLVIRDPLGWHQIKTGNVRVYACIQRVDRSGAGTPETFVQGPPGSRYVDTTNNELWVKKTGLFTTGWIQSTPTMVGDSGSGGKRGAVPAPAAGDAAAGKFLKADGTWAAPSGGGSTASTTEVLTGTDNAKSATPDAIAALWEKGSDVASSATISLGEGGLFHVTGTTDISDIDFATDKAGRTAKLRFDDTLSLVNSATLICPENRDLLVHADDVVVVASEGSDVVRVLAHLPAYSRLKQTLASDETGTNVNTAQPWFPSNPAIPVKAGVVYRFRGYLRTSRAAGNNSHTTAVLFGGTATLTRIRGRAHSKAGDTSGLAAGAEAMIDAATATTFKTTSTSTTEQTMLWVEGHVVINAAGTFEPQFQYSAAPGGAPTILAGSFFELVPVSKGTVVEIGPWA